MHKPQDFLQLSDVLSEQQSRITQQYHVRTVIIIQCRSYRFTHIHFLWPSFSVVFKNNNPFIFIPLMPSVNHVLDTCGPSQAASKVLSIDRPCSPARGSKIYYMSGFH